MWLLFSDQTLTIEEKVRLAQATKERLEIIDRYDKVPLHYLVCLSVCVCTCLCLSVSFRYFSVDMTHGSIALQIYTHHGSRPLINLTHLVLITYDPLTLCQLRY